MPDLSDERPERWWVLNPDAHATYYCGNCLIRRIDPECNVPMLDDKPLCGVCAGQMLSDTPQTAEYARWLDEGDPRWWSAWMCNCPYCDAERLMHE